MTTVFRGSAAADGRAPVPVGARMSPVRPSRIAARILVRLRMFRGPLSFNGRDIEVVERAPRSLTEEPLAQWDGDALLRRFGVLEREGVDAAEEAVPDVHGIHLVDEELAPPERRVHAGVRHALDIERDPDPVDPGDLTAVDEVLGEARRIGPGESDGVVVPAG